VEESDDSGSLRAVGVTGFDEDVYRTLLGHRDATPAELGAELGCAADRVDRALTRLRLQGLVSRLSGRRRRYTAVEPDAAVEALVRHRRTQLEAVRSTAMELSSLFHSVQRGDGRGGAVELLEGPQSLGRWFVRLQHQVREEMMVLDRPPYALAQSNPIEPASLAGGVRWRGIYTPEALEVPGAMEEVERLGALGEESRVLPDLPMKLAIADRQVALLPLSLDLATTRALLIRESTLLNALIDLFESYWERALPLVHTERSEAAHPGDGREADGPDEADRALVALLASGMTDAAIARRLGLSTRTMRRRTRRLFDELSASNRFQAGVQASRRGWL
jgi:DNA-binding CsgD family transcriptional regulator